MFKKSKSLEIIRQKKENTQNHIEDKLKKRLKIFAIIISVILCVVIYNLFTLKLTLLLTLLAIFIGFIVGFIAGRMFKIFWHIETQKVVYHLDTLGIIIFILYIIIEFNRKWFFSHWLHGAKLNAFALAFLAGVLIGRLTFMTKNIKKILTIQNKI